MAQKAPGLSVEKGLEAVTWESLLAHCHRIRVREHGVQKENRSSGTEEMQMGLRSIWK